MNQSEAYQASQKARELLETPDLFFAWMKESKEGNLTFVPRSIYSCPLAVFLEEKGIKNTSVTGSRITTTMTVPFEDRYTFVPKRWIIAVTTEIDHHHWRRKEGEVALPLKRGLAVLMKIKSRLEKERK